MKGDRTRRPDRARRGRRFHDFPVEEAKQKREIEKRDLTIEQLQRQLAELQAQLDHGDTEVIRHGRETWLDQYRRRRRRITFEQWMSIARAIAAGRQATMRQLGMTEPIGARYARAFSAWLYETGFEEIEKTTRSRLLECLDNLPAIEVWRQQLDPERRREWNHPHAVLAQWRAHRGASRGQPETETVPVEPEPPPPTEIAWPPEIRRRVEAEILPAIAAIQVEGFNLPGAIRAELDRRGIPSPSGGRWTAEELRPLLDPELFGRD